LRGLPSVELKASIIPPGSIRCESVGNVAMQPDTLRIPLGENMTIQIFSFFFSRPPLIDAILFTGIASRQVR
jgi:hypothetical protein